MPLRCFKAANAATLTYIAYVRQTDRTTDPPWRDGSAYRQENRELQRKSATQKISLIHHATRGILEIKTTRSIGWH
jgi:hypothetical protein